MIGGGLHALVWHMGCVLSSTDIEPRLELKYARAAATSVTTEQPEGIVCDLRELNM